MLPMSETDEQKRIAAAARARRYRKRKRTGKSVILLELNRDDIADALVEIGALEAWDAEDAEAIRVALKSALEGQHRDPTRKMRIAEGSIQSANE
jgi:hypothetical protein